ncbi:hypothetical protein IHE45_20G083800 [Dioscorea alata]|uniref:Uncharacterized protein n=2 Tax=Dioscorea alata TaxID=55571 RepID=A0ACB7TTK4_DIOAL|nr:hypothetical protein IHE45_20G083800 [Dioscorea alata]KAH7651851.1 hypothetical protein IHE45_20G083800 [Dioscorea alata]
MAAATAAAAAARSVFRSSSVRSMATRLSAGTSASRPPLRIPKPQRPAAPPPSLPRILRSPVEMSFCVESLLPMHSVTAAALMNSMLSIPGNGYGWLLEAGNDDV